MKKLLFILALLFAGVVSGASLLEDITAQGNTSYLHKSVTAQQLATSIRDYEDSTAVNTLLYTECGKTVFLNSATEFATTLPSPVAGCTFTFIVKAAPSGASYTVVTASSANVIVGGVNELEVDTGDDGPSFLISDPADTVTLVDGVSVAGDWIKVVSDGTYWFLSGSVKADGGVTLASS